MSSARKSEARDSRASSSKPANNGQSSEKATKSGNETTDDRNKPRRPRHHDVPADPIYNVYLCYFNTNLSRLDFEVGLLIATDERIIRKGHYYEVKGPRPARGHKDRLEYHLYYSIIKSPENSMNFRKLAHVGRIRETQLYLALRIAEQIPPPQVVLTHTGESPNCIDWMNNFLFELARFKVVDFDPDFKTPRKKRLMIHTSLMSPDELIAVGMSPALSNEYVPESELGSRSKRNKTNSQSKNDQASSNQEPSSSKKSETSPRNEPPSSKALASSSKQAQASSQRDKSGSSSKSGKISSSSKQGKDESKHKHLSIRRFFSKK